MSADSPSKREYQKDSGCSWPSLACLIPSPYPLFLPRLFHPGKNLQSGGQVLDADPGTGKPQAAQAVELLQLG